jgi:hypothetical protein
LLGNEFQAFSRTIDEILSKNGFMKKTGYFFKKEKR